MQRLVVRALQQLLPPVAQLFANRLLHPRIVQLALSRRLLRDQLDDAVAEDLVRRLVAAGSGGVNCPGFSRLIAS